VHLLVSPRAVRHILGMTASTEIDGLVLPDSLHNFRLERCTVCGIVRLVRAIAIRVVLTLSTATQILLLSSRNDDFQRAPLLRDRRRSVLFTRMAGAVISCG
jgi:hypothetical protein